MQFNCNGLQGKINEITRFMQLHKVMVGAIQETKLNATCSLQSCNNYNILRKDRTRSGGGGLAFIIDNTVQYRSIPPDPNVRDLYLEHQGIAVRSGAAEIELYNVYIPPVASCPTGYHPDISFLLNGVNRMVMGDFNAHHELWHSNLGEDQRGIALAEQVDDSTFCTLNEDAPTRIVGRCTSSPDITISSAGLINYAIWRPIISLASDHLPIIITLDKPNDFIVSERRTYINQKKADWLAFKEFTNRKFSGLPIPTEVRSAERKFREIVNAAAARFIPAGRIPILRPNFPAEAAGLADERDEIRSTNPSDPRIGQLNREISKLVNEHKRNKWVDHLKTCNLSTGASKLWSTVKSLSNPSKRDDRISITFADKTFSDPKRCASSFSRQFIEHPERDKAKRSIVRKLHDLRVTDEPHAFTSTEVAEAINRAKPSKALGPDGISMLMLKQLDAPGVEYLTNVLNLSIATLIIPEVWKMGRVIPLLKPGKSADQGESYRPISLLSPVAKTLEALLLPSLTQHFQLAQHQHGFRKQHSTTTALTAIATQISDGLNQSRPCERTVLVALDLSKAFDTVSHTTLFRDIADSSLPNNLKRWTVNYLCGRQSFVEFRGKKSKPRRIKQGVPQGGVISPLLFNFYISKLPAPPEGVELISYADDCTILATGHNVDSLCGLVNGYLREITDFFTGRNLQLSPAKSSATLFTTWTKEVRLELNVAIDGVQIPTLNYPKILGVTFDSMFVSSAHATAICNKMQSRNKVLKSLAGSSWGMDKETLLTTYKTIGRSVVNYAAPVWSPRVSDTQWRKLQTCQNSALRTITGCVKMSSIQHLHEETKVLTVKEHSQMLTKQFLLGCHRRGHPNHHLTELDPPPRHVRKDLRIFEGAVQGYVRDPMNETSYRAGLNDIHRDTVNDATNSYQVNVVLGGRPPPIAEEERTLPRRTRVVLAQLRSGWCTRLNSYWSRIEPTIPDTCPACQRGPHDVHHLFNCGANATHLGPESIWTHPIEVAQFLGLDLDELPAEQNND